MSPVKVFTCQSRTHRVVMTTLTTRLSGRRNYSLIAALLSLLLDYTKYVRFCNMADDIFCRPVFPLLLSMICFIVSLRSFSRKRQEAVTFPAAIATPCVFQRAKRRLRFNRTRAALLIVLSLKARKASQTCRSDSLYSTVDRTSRRSSPQAARTAFFAAPYLYMRSVSHSTMFESLPSRTSAATPISLSMCEYICAEYALPTEYDGK